MIVHRPMMNQTQTTPLKGRCVTAELSCQPRGTLRGEYPRNKHEAVNIGGAKVESVNKFKHPGNVIVNKLTFDENTDAVY